MHSLHFIRSHSSLLGAKPWIKYVSRFYNKEEGTNFDFDRVNSWNGWCLLVIKLGYFPGVLLQYLQLDEVGTLMVSRKYESFKFLDYFRSLKEWLVSNEEVKLIQVLLCPCIAYLLPPSIYICPGWWLEIHPKMWLMRVKTGIEIDPQPSARIIRYYIDWFGWKHSLEYQAFYCGSDEF